MVERIRVFAGADVGAACLATLLDRGDPVDRVIAATANDVAVLELAARAGVAAEVYAPDVQDRLAATRCGWLLNLWSPHIFRRPLLASANKRLNLHPGLTPHGRGADCAAWALRLRAPAGVSLLEIDAGVDTAPVWAERSTPYDVDTRGRTLQAALKRDLIALFRERWPAIQAGQVAPRAQSSGPSARRRAETDADRRRDGSEAGTLSDFVAWALAHDFSDAIAAELTLGDRRFKVRLTLEDCDPEP